MFKRPMRDLFVQVASGVNAQLDLLCYLCFVNVKIIFNISIKKYDRLLL